MRYLAILLALTACTTASTPTPSAGPSEAGGVVLEDIENYFANTYLDRPKHKAFALAFGNYPEDDGFASGIAYHGHSPQDAMNTAIKWCDDGKRKHEVEDLECLIYAINDTVVGGMSDEEFQAVIDSY